jgi:hypothetical protein
MAMGCLWQGPSCRCDVDYDELVKLDIGQEQQVYR